ncbi:MAG: phosphomannomutase, partial [Boseongicola sp.]|nr:phosphomannomutase [Boseongicola sp.]
SAEMLPLATRDAVLPILAVLTGGGGGSVSELVASLPMRRTATDRLKDVPREASDTLVRSILGGDTSALPDDLGDIQNIDQTDGVRMLFETGTIVTIRPSGNAPELRCYVEADTEAEASRVMQSTLKNMREIVSG